MARPPCCPRRSTSSCMKARADWGAVSRPSSQAWIATGSSCRCPTIAAATRWWSSACTPPLPIRPSRCRVRPVRRSSPHSSTKAGMWKNAPESIACEMRTMSCGTTRPAPRFRCPTSLLPICPSGSPTERPDAFSSVRGAFAQRRCQVGVRPSSIAFPIWPGRKPQPSSTIRTTGVRGPCLFAILEGMQFSHALRALPVVCSLAPALPAPSPDTTGQAAARYRVATDGEWFYQEVTGKRLARLARGAVVAGGDTKGEWIGVTLDGWIFGTSVGVTPRAGFDLAVARAPEENLRAAPGGTIIAKLAEGFLLTKLGENGPWVHVERAGWVKRAALDPVVVANSRTAESDSSQGGSPPGRRSGVADSAGPAGDPNRAQPARRTVLYRAPDGPPAGTLTPSTPLKVLAKSGEWARVQVEGGVKTSDLEPAPPVGLVGVGAAELRAEPQRFAGQTLRWTLQIIAVQQADELRPEMPKGAIYFLARGPLPERGFVYVIVPEGKRALVEGLAPLATIQVTARVRAGRSRFLGNPVLDLLSLEPQS